jgi:hypothetical protein
MTDNLALWNLVERTDPKHVKPITGKAYQGNSPKPHYLIHKATETFGPCGIGWGFDIVEEKLLDGALLEPGFYERIHMARVRVWYEWDGKRGTVEHVGQTMFSGKRRDGKTYTDEDAPKKSVTDALVKALSLIGFAGDIFMGRYDDSKYVQELRDEANGHSAADRIDDVAAYLAGLRTQIENHTDPDVLTTWWADETKAIPGAVSDEQFTAVKAFAVARLKALKGKPNGRVSK